MKERGVREHTIEFGRGKFQGEKILVPDFDTCQLSRHLHERLGAVEPDGPMSASLQCSQIAPGSTTEVEDPIRRFPVNRIEQRVDVLRNIVIARALPEMGRVTVVALERDPRDLGELRGRKASQPFIHTPASTTSVWPVMSRLSSDAR